MPIGDLSFTFPLALLPAIALIPALWWFFRSRRDEGIALRGIDDYRRAFGSDRLLRAVMYGSLALSVAAVCVLAAGPRISERQVSVSKEGVDIALVLDLSKSMLAEDMTPNRIGAAKNVIKDFLRRLDGDRIGLVLFAGKPFVSVPLSFDYASIAMMTDRITTDSIDQSAGAWLQWTAMGDGMLAAIDMLERARKEAITSGETPRERVIIAMTDGEANVGINPTVAAKLAKEKNIRVHTVGIGKEWTPLVMTDESGKKHPFMDQNGNPLIATLDRETLENVSRLTDGRTFYASDEGSLDRVFSTLADLERREARSENTISHTLIVWPLLWILALSLSVSAWTLRTLGRTSSIGGGRTYTVLPRQRLVRVGLGVSSGIFLAAMISPIVFGFGWASTEDRSILWIVDVSKSMDAQDVSRWSDESRLDRAKRLILETMTAYHWSEQWIAVFAWDAILMSPQSRDTETLLSFVRGLDSTTVSRGGTNLADALALASWRADDSAPTTVVIITDGGDPGETDSAQIAKMLGSMPATLFVWLGSRDGAPIPAWVDPFGNPLFVQYRGERVISRLNSDLLDTLSDTAGTLWQENPDAIALPKPKNGTGSIRQPGWAEERPILAWILLPLWLATIFLPDTKRHG